MTKRKAPQWQFPGYVCEAMEFGLGGGGVGGRKLQGGLRFGCLSEGSRMELLFRFWKVGMLCLVGGGIVSLDSLYLK
jgi:hypothetical protein